MHPIAFCDYVFSSLYILSISMPSLVNNVLLISQRSIKYSCERLFSHSNSMSLEASVAKDSNASLIVEPTVLAGNGNFHII